MILRGKEHNKQSVGSIRACIKILGFEPTGQVPLELQTRLLCLSGYCGRKMTIVWRAKEGFDDFARNNQEEGVLHTIST